MKICLLGASFNTGNLGVSALAESSIKVILHRWPDAEIILLGSGYAPQQQRLLLLQKEVCVRTVPVRFSKNIFLPYHFLWFVLYGLITKILPTSRLKNGLVNRNPYFKAVYETDIVMDITGGDSFSDIYGFRRFFIGFLCKWLVIFLGKKLILLPQTYGPFKNSLSKAMARYVVNRAILVYSRDRVGVEDVKNLLNIHTQNGKVRFAPDVAFVLDCRKPVDFDKSFLSRTGRDITVVGINISGLLFNGGYNRNNMFGLRTDYRELVCAIIEMLLRDDSVVVVLVAHVFPQSDCEVESDMDACSKVYQMIGEKYKGRIFPAEGKYDQNEIKYIIGRCDFFIGSRMHSCIAALSQGIPAVGLAYSKKFRGVFQTVGMERFAVDMRQPTQEEILSIVNSAFENRLSTAAHLRDVIAELQNTVLDVLKGICC
ncbi:MAG: polysaccharide pyruvyl transferase family protein [Phycisphaerae bacterium]|nr:polysaccharide pyruvyl transferase family protein [Phycisphaerae bacterium]